MWKPYLNVIAAMLSATPTTRAIGLPTRELPQCAGASS
jgi:hypothetical protein